MMSAMPSPVNVDKFALVGVVTAPVALGAFSLRAGPDLLVLVIHRVGAAKLAACKSDGFVLSGKRSHWSAARAHNAACSHH
jgi:hypothetical protein